MILAKLPKHVKADSNIPLAKGVRQGRLFYIENVLKQAYVGANVARINPFKIIIDWLNSTNNN
jgi:hypothetical protein